MDSAKNSLNDLQNLKLQKQEKSRIDAKAKEREQSDQRLVMERRLAETEKKVQAAEKSSKQKAEDNSQLNQPSPSENPLRPSLLPNGQAYKYAWLSEREVTDADLKGKTGDELVIMRNSIYARHGFIFKSDEIREVFNKEPWYKAISPEVGNMLSSLEKENVKKIQAREGK